MKEGCGRIADDDDRAGELVAPQLERGGASGGLELRGQGGGSRVAQGAEDLVFGRQPGACDAVGHHVRIAENGSAVAECLSADLGCGWRGENQRRKIGHAAGVDHADDDAAEIG